MRPFSASSVDFPRRLCNGGEHSSPCAPPEAPCSSARSPYRSLPGRLFAGTWCSGKVSPRGEARCSGASSSRILPENHSISASSDRMILLQSRPRPAYAARKVGSPPVGSGRAPFGESFDLRRLRPNDSPPVVSAARPPQARLVPLRFACSSNLLSVLLRRPGEQITEARLSLRSNPFGGSFFRSLRSHKSTGRCVPCPALAESDLPCAGSGQIRFSRRSGLLLLPSVNRPVKLIFALQYHQQGSGSN